MNIGPIPEALPKSVDDTISGLTVPLAKTVGATFSDIWDIVFYGIHGVAEKRRIKVNRNVELFKESLEVKVLAIPQEKRLEPRLQIVGPALERAKYCVEEEVLREMFANLIAASMDSDYAAAVHPSFPEILAQMSPLDAQNLSLFLKIPILPIAEYNRRSHSSAGGYTMIDTHVFLSNAENQNIAAQAHSISSLAHFGLISISYERHLTKEDAYDDFLKHPHYHDLKKSEITLEKVRESTVETPDGPWQFDNLSKDTQDKLLEQHTKEIELQKGAVLLTPLGRAFISACLR